MFDINYDLINEILKTRKPTIVSIVVIIKTNRQNYKSFKLKKVKINILHCVSSYPNKDVLILFIKHRIFKKRYN